MEAQAKAKQALLEKAKKNDPTNDPEFAARQQARIEAARQREERAAEQRRAKEAERESQRAARAAKIAARAEQLRAAEEERRRKADEIRLATEVATKEALRQSRKTKPASLGLQDLKSALESRGK